MKIKRNVIIGIFIIALTLLIASLGCGKKKTDPAAAAAATEEFEIVGAIE